MESFEYSIGHSNDSNFNILQPDFIPETDLENLISAIQCETKDPNDIFCVDLECNHFTNACTAFQLSPQLYDHNDIGNGTGFYDEMDPNFVYSFSYIPILLFLSEIKDFVRSPFTPPPLLLCAFGLRLVTVSEESPSLDAFTASSSSSQIDVTN
ncbi:myc-type, basic helix-loop-helix (bHLH) domain-containing protein [Artemisia annua]|uniref:Myc-type, basic helix-loop-helix (BHLH) domain-containing protein n=1 Tax=Artemisia annua TaxID=35608 RepID=A0A2U1LE61_ARTAN|nr:myc-type, basic helix-loop-helix (bHLH) domain-containing protein [Artemisia annua]